jgi:hypothetical protein
MANVIAFQVALAATATPQNLPANPVLRSVTIEAPAANTAAVVIGNSSAVTSSTGFNLDKGQIVTIPLSGGNTSALWIVGTSGDKCSVIGA